MTPWKIQKVQSDDFDINPAAKMNVLVGTQSALRLTIFGFRGEGEGERWCLYRISVWLIIMYILHIIQSVTLAFSSEDKF